jgi:hypothetical protein
MPDTRRLAATALMSLALAGCATSAAVDPSASQPATDKPAGISGTCTLLVELDVVPEPEPGDLLYERDLFGGYNRRALLNETLYQHGDYYSRWDDRHYTDPSEVDVDHTVALSEAWDSGAYAWPHDRPDLLMAFAGDPDNLTLLTDNVNQSKGDDDPAEWLPPRKRLHDEYAKAWVKVKAAYDLTVDPDEHAVLNDALRCGDRS